MKFKTQNLKLFLILLPFIAGCATILEPFKGIAAISTRELEKGRSQAIIKQANYDYHTAYKKIKEGLIARGSYIYAESAVKQMLAFYVSEEDTTPVGIFFKELDANNTQLEISSPSKFAKEFIANRVTVILEEAEKKQAQEDAQKQEAVNK